MQQDRGVVLPDGGDRLVQGERQVEPAALPIARQVLRAAIDGAVRLDDAGTADADERREPQSFLARARDQALEHVDQLLDRVLALELLLVAVTPELEFPDRGLGQVGRLLQIERDHAGTDIGAADVHRQDRVVGLEHPTRRQMRGADQAGLVGVVADRHEIDGHLVGLQDHGRAPDRKLADAAGAEAASDHDPLGVAPGLELEEAADDERKLLREVLDRALHDAGRLRIALGQQRVELLPADVLARLVAERVVAGLAQGLAPVLDDLAEGAFVGAVADEALVVLQLDIVAVDLDGGEAACAMRGDRRQSRALIRHEPVPVPSPVRGTRQQGTGRKVSCCQPDRKARRGSGGQRATIGCAASAGSRNATPGNTEPSSNHDFGAGWPHRVCRCGSRSDQRIGSRSGSTVR